MSSTTVTIRPAPTGMQGAITLPGDKSISHRSVMFAAIAQGESHIRNCSGGGDNRSTIGAFRTLGVDITQSGTEVHVKGRGWSGLHPPQQTIDCGNSGTTMRLLSGLLAARPFLSRLDGDESLRGRPMGRVIGPLTDMGADTTFSIVRRGHIINGAAPTRFHHTIEQYDVDHDRSEQFTGCKVVGLSLNIVPGQPVTCAWNIMGFNRTLLDTGLAPYYVTPSLTTGLAMVGDEIALRYNGALATRFTSLKLDFNLAAAGVGVLGSLTTPDIFDNDLSIDATATVIRASHSDLTLYEAETAFEMSLVLENRVSVAPFECYGFSFPVVTIDDQKAPVGGGDGPKVDTLQLGFGTKVAATGYDGTKFIVSSSAIA